MARLVARALRVGRSALIQTDSLAAYKGTHRLSYLIPALLWPEPAVLALPDALLETVLQQDIPDLQQSLPIIKPVRMGDRWPSPDFRGLLVTSAKGWLRDRLQSQQNEANSKFPTKFPTRFPTRFPTKIPTLIDGVSDLESWIRETLTVSLSAPDWEALMLAYPGQQAFIRDLRVRITHAIFQHPANPYSCHLIDQPEAALLHELFDALHAYGDDGRLPSPWQAFAHHLARPERLAWSRLNRELGSVVLSSAPTDIDTVLAPVWAQQPVVLMGADLDTDQKAKRYRDRLGLGDMTCLRFGPDRHHDLVQLYLPDRLPMPNTSHFRAAVLQEIRRLLCAQISPPVLPHAMMSMDVMPIEDADGVALTAEADNASSHGPTVIIIGDVPLRAQFASILAAEFGSRIQVESPVGSNGILITGWAYWQANQASFQPPSLLIVTTLPIPSLENPLVAGRVATYKRRRQDWFKAYLLPETLSTLQRAIAPVRQCKGASVGVVALLDNRVNHRSYGRTILSALSPAARSSYLDPTWFIPAGMTPANT